CARILLYYYGSSSPAVDYW
nr:immunoglobulin heavy chain junction region [Mus musculus]